MPLVSRGTSAKGVEENESSEAFTIEIYGDSAGKFSKYLEQDESVVRESANTSVDDRKDYGAFRIKDIDFWLPPDCRMCILLPCAFSLAAAPLDLVRHYREAER